MIVGPAGTGKTVLLSSWLEQASNGRVGRVRWKNAHDDIRLGEVLLLAVGVREEQARALASEDDVDASVAIRDELERRLQAGA
jgi:ATP/maltotriose-dependent transcriptional regulator MalT